MSPPNFNYSFKFSRLFFKFGINFPIVSFAIEICIAVGKTSFVDWDLFTWSFGWTGFFVPFLPPSISMALLAITSLTFILVCVPDPVCQTLRGKCLSNLPDIISSDALIIALDNLGKICFSLPWTIAAAFLMIAIDLIKTGLTKN